MKNARTFAVRNHIQNYDYIDNNIHENSFEGKLNTIQHNKDRVNSWG